MSLSPYAGKPAPQSILENIPKLMTDYYNLIPDASNPDQAVAFGTSGHRGSASKTAFNENHIAAISQAIVEYRDAQGISGPIYIGMDSHALSEAAHATAIEVFAGNSLNVIIQARAVTRRRRSFRTPFSPTTKTAPMIWPTASSSRHRTIHRKTAASNTTRQTAARPIPMPLP